MQGGGWCADLESCYKRSSTRLGSSSSYEPTMKILQGYFSNDSSVNPQVSARVRWFVLCPFAEFDSLKRRASAGIGSVLHGFATSSLKMYNWNLVSVPTAIFCYFTWSRYMLSFSGVHQVL